MKSHLPIVPAPRTLSSLVLTAALFVLPVVNSFAAGAMPAGENRVEPFTRGALESSTASVSLSGGTLQRTGQAGEVFAPLQVTTRSLRGFGTAKQEGQFFLFEDIFRSLDHQWAGFNFTITALPETPAVVGLAALLVFMFYWPVRRRIIKDLKSIVGLRPPGRVRIEAYRRRANDDGRPRQEVWSRPETVVLPAAPAAKPRERFEPEALPADETLVSA